jgi:hypothetical protein
MPNVMLILRGIKGTFDGKDWPRGALYEAPALEYARRRGYGGKVLDVAGAAYDGSPQVVQALAAFRADKTVTAFYGFSGGGYNLKHILDDLSDEERDRIRLVVVLGAPGNSPSDYHGHWELVYRLDPGHMAGPSALLGDLVAFTATETS